MAPDDPSKEVEGPGSEYQYFICDALICVGRFEMAEPEGMPPMASPCMTSMRGFYAAHPQGCIAVLFEGWVVDTPLKEIYANLGTRFETNCGLYYNSFLSLFY